MTAQMRHALVTGAAGGIGGAIARRLAAEGVAVVATDLPGDALDRLGDEPGVRVLEADLANRATLPALVADAAERAGGLDILVNAAGLYPNRPLLDMDDDEWDRVLGINLSSVFSLSRAFAARLVPRGTPGHIVNIGSGASTRARRGAAHYCVSKAGLDMLTKAFAMEMAEHQIHVNAVAPGFIEVDSKTNPLRPEYVAAIRGGQP